MMMITIKMMIIMMMIKVMIEMIKVIIIVLATIGQIMVTNEHNDNGENAYFLASLGRQKTGPIVKSLNNLFI